MRKTLATIFLSLILATAVAQGRFVFPTTVAPLVKAQWAQDYPYNKLCPWETVDSVATHAYAGCAPLVMSQVMSRYKFPSESRTLGSTYDWDNIFYTLSDTLTTAEEDVVARLIVDCGTSANTVYGQSASATKLNDVVTGLKRDFSYSPYMSIADRSHYAGNDGARTWKTLIYNELKAGRPVIMRGEQNAHFAHVFIIDGCRDSTVHVNFGWGGKRNGYYDPDTLYGFKSNQRMIVGIAPKGKYVPRIRQITLDAPGQLSRHITEADWLTLRHVKVSGPINRADVALLRRLAGGTTKGQRSGNLATIDLSLATTLALPDSAFYGCENLTYITLPRALPQVSNSCFNGCAKLNRVDFQHSVVNVVGNRAFFGCFCLTDVNMPQTLRTIGSNAFNSCNSLTEVVLPPSVSTVGNGAFAFAKRLYRLVVPRTARLGTDTVKGTHVNKIIRL